MQVHQRLVDRAFRAEQHAPGVGAHEEVRPERQNHQKEREILRALAFARADEERQRIARQQADDGRQQRDPDRIEEDREVNRSEDALIMLERQRKDNRAVATARHEADEQHNHQGQQEEEEQPEDGGQRQQPAARALSGRMARRLAEIQTECHLTPAVLVCRNARLENSNYYNKFPHTGY